MELFVMSILKHRIMKIGTRKGMALVLLLLQVILNCHKLLQYVGIPDKVVHVTINS